MRLQPHTAAWYDRLATRQTGYYYPWRSRLGAWHGEDAYAALVRESLRPDSDVLDVACGHGAVTIGLAPACRSVLGYDRTAPYIDLARQTAHERGLKNVTFVCHDSSPEANGGYTRIPAADSTFDLLICSKGPFHWIADARRVARPGALLIMLVPDMPPLPAWHAELPEPLQWTLAPDPLWPRPSIEQRLAAAGLSLNSWWSFDVPEVFPDAEQVYRWRTFGTTAEEVPSFDTVRPLLERIFEVHGTPDGLELRYRRHLWTAVVPD